MTTPRAFSLVVTAALAGVFGGASAAFADVVARVGGTSSRVPASVAPPAGSSAEKPVVAGRAGRWLVDPAGRVVVLHGLNMVAKRPPYLPSRMGFDATDARWLREQGFTTVRLGLIATGIQPAPGAYDEAYLNDIAGTIRELDAAGLAVLVDLHQDYYTESTGGEGFPGWMVHKRQGLPGLAGGRGDAAPFDGLWATDDGVQDSIGDIWAHVAGRLRSVPGILGYDLFNEPYPGSRADECAGPAGCRSFDEQVLTPFYRRLIAGVRSADPRRLVFVEPGVSFNQGVASWLGDLGDDRTGFSFHVYCSPAANAASCVVRTPQAFTNAERQSRVGRGSALLLTEFGATDDLSRLRSVLDEADRAMVGWQQWAYFNEDPFAARPHEGLVRSLDRPAAETVKREKLAVLARPAPVLIAGTPLGWRWDEGAGRLEVRWSTTAVPGATLRGVTGRRVVRGVAGRRAVSVRSARALRRVAGRAVRAVPVKRAGRKTRLPAYVAERPVSTIVVPPASVPGAFTVQVSGGRVVSAAGDRTVRILADPGAGTVTAVVQRG